jgi:putative NIF3 family GTP cyclohydrolase 1 type 2
MVAHDMALYAAHLPLDLHPEVGNNVQLANRLGLVADATIGDFQGVPLGVAGSLTLHRDDLVARLSEALCTNPKLIAGGPAACSRVGIITGGAGSMIADAVAAGCDTFITGEGSHHTYFDAHEWGINVIYAGHYATEQLGVQALAATVSERFDIPWVFHDHPTGL